MRLHWYEYGRIHPALPPSITATDISRCGTPSCSASDDAIGNISAAAALLVSSSERSAVTR